MTKAELEQTHAEALELLKECKNEILELREDIEEAEVIMEVLQDFRILQNELLDFYRKNQIRVI